MISFAPLRFTCHGTGDCCHFYDVYQNRGECWAECLPKTNPLPKLANKCSLLTGIARCSIYNQRPEQCRQFPFEVIDTPLGPRVTLSPECQCVFDSEITGGPIHADPSAITAVDVFYRNGPAVRLPKRIPIDEGAPEITFDQYLKLEQFLIGRACAPEQALADLKAIITDLSVTGFVSEPIALSLQRLNPKPIAQADHSGAAYAFKLRIYQGWPARSGTLRRGLVDLSTWWERATGSGSPIQATRAVLLPSPIEVPLTPTQDHQVID